MNLRPPSFFIQVATQALLLSFLSPQSPRIQFPHYRWRDRLTVLILASLALLSPRLESKLLRKAYKTFPDLARWSPGSSLAPLLPHAASTVQPHCPACSSPTQTSCACSFLWALTFAVPSSGNTSCTLSSSISFLINYTYYFKIHINRPIKPFLAPPTYPTLGQVSS